MISCSLLFSCVDFLLWFSNSGSHWSLSHLLLSPGVYYRVISRLYYEKKSSGSEFEIKLSLNFIYKTCIAGSKKASTHQSIAGLPSHWFST